MKGIYDGLKNHLQGRPRVIGFLEEMDLPCQVHEGELRGLADLERGATVVLLCSADEEFVRVDCGVPGPESTMNEIGSSDAGTKMDGLRDAGQCFVGFGFTTITPLPHTSQPPADPISHNSELPAKPDGYTRVKMSNVEPWADRQYHKSRPKTTKTGEKIYYHQV